MAVPQRKNPRLTGYDYSQGGVYFVTVCTKDRAHLLSTVGRDDLGAPQVELSSIGKITEKYTESISTHYQNVSVEKYVIMPNHVHMIIALHDGAPGSSRPTVSQIIGAWKRYVNRECNFSLWQPSFYDEIIRNDAHFLNVWQYIDGNPAKWTEDEYYTE